MSFFESEIVRNEASQISDLQKEIINMIPKIPILPREERIEYFDKMINLIERQKIFYNRLSLSDDPNARELKNQFKQAAIMLGMNAQHLNMNEIYDDFIQSMSELRQQTLDGII